MSPPLQSAGTAARMLGRWGGQAIGRAVRARAVTRLAAVVAVVAGAVVVFQYGALGLARHLGLVARREPFTALAFAHPDALPGRVAPGSLARFEVRVQNHEGAGRRYRWDLELVRPGAARAVLARGTEAVPDAATRTFVVGARMPAAAGAVRLVLRLASPSEAISVRVAVG